MNKENAVFASKTVELSEHKTYLEMLNRVCYYGAPNANGVELPIEGALEKAQSLVDMPVKAKYAVNHFGQPTFKGHEVYTDVNGEMAYDTENIGVHTEVYVAEDEVEVDGAMRRLPCLFAKQKVWTRNKNVASACRRLYELGQLHNSWEITTDKYEYAGGVKRLIDYAFEANTFLGADLGYRPAYGKSAKVLNLSTEEGGKEPVQMDSVRLIAEALAMDKTADATEESEGQALENDKKILTEPVVEANPVEPVAPVEETTATKPVEQETEEESVGKKKRKGCAEDESEELSTLKATIASKNEDIVSMGKRIRELEAEVANLSTFKEAYDKAEAERLAQEKAKEVSELEQFVKDSDMFTEEEISSEDIQNLIQNCDKASLVAEIANRVVIAQRTSKKPETVVSTIVEKSGGLTADAVDEVSGVSNYAKVIADFFR